MEKHNEMNPQQAALALLMKAAGSSKGIFIGIGGEDGTTAGLSIHTQKVDTSERIAILEIAKHQFMLDTFGGR